MSALAASPLAGAELTSAAVAPQTVHHNGKRYEWSDGLATSDPIAKSHYAPAR